MRQDIQATAAAGVWRSPSPLAMPHVVATVNAAASGTVWLWWSGGTPSVPYQAGSPPDAVLAAGQRGTFDTGLTGHRTVYVADSGGGSFDVSLLGDSEPIAASPEQLFAPPAASVQMQFVEFDRTVPIDGASNIIPGVAGKAITVFGYAVTLCPVGTVVGNYEARMRDDVTLLVIPLRMSLSVGGASGTLAVPLSHTFPPGGLVLPLGAGLELATGAANPSNVEFTGVVEYTQQ